jgi:hypothetical protein
MLVNSGAADNLAEAFALIAEKKRAGDIMI